jgi:hypothetical protein
MDRSIFSLDELRAALLQAVARALDGAGPRVRGATAAPEEIRLTARLTPAVGRGSGSRFRFWTVEDPRCEVLEVAFVWAAGPPASMNLVNAAPPAWLGPGKR